MAGATEFPRDPYLLTQSEAGVETVEAVAFLAQVARTLGSTLDYESTLQAIVALAVPRLADGCAIHVLGEQGRIVLAAIRHVEPAQEASIRELCHLYPPMLNALDSPVAQVIRSGQLQFVTSGTEAALQAIATDERHLRLLQELAVREYLILPLATTPGQILGALDLLLSDPTRHFRPADFDLARELSSRAAQAVGNAQLFAEARRASAEKETLLALLDAMLAATPVGLGFLDRELRYVRVNDTLAAMNGLPAAAHLGRTVREVLPGLAAAMEPLLQRVFTTGKPSGKVEVRGETPAHPRERRCREVNYFPVPGTSGEVVLAGVAAIDVTDHVQAVEARQQGEALLAQVLETLPVGVWIQDAEGAITHGNRAGQQIWGGARYVGPQQFGEYKGWWAETGQPIEPDEWAAARAIRRGETSLDELIVIQCFDGSRKTILNSAVPLRDADGRITGGIIVNQDVTDRHQAEVELATQAGLADRRLAEVEATYATAPVGLCVLDHELRYLRINERLAQINGLPAAEHIGRTIFEVVPDLAPKIESLARAVLRTGVAALNVDVSGETPAQPGVRRSWISHWYALRDRGGAVVGINVVAEEITERKRTEEAVRQLQRLEAVGQLAGGIAHEANNQMTVVLGNAGFLDRYNLPPEAQECVQAIRRAGERTALITRQLLAFSRRQMLQPQLVSVNRIVSELEPQLSRILGEQVELEYRLTGEHDLIRADPGQLKQVFISLASNARDAMAGGGRLTIETSPVDLSGAQELTHRVAWMTPGRYMLVTVTDTGHGMDSETLAHVFEPFFTTKPVGQGPGLGLSTVYGIVKQMGGYIWANSEPGQGATFKIYLPLDELVEKTRLRSAPL